MPRRTGLLTDEGQEPDVSGTEPSGDDLRVGDEPASRTAWVPVMLLIVLMLLLFGFVLTQADAHGRSYDEPLQNEYGHRVFDWYRTAGSDTRFLDFPVRQQMPQHGPFFETVVAAAQATSSHLLGDSSWADPWRVRSVVCGLAGLAGVGLIALCGIELGRGSRRLGRTASRWLGLVAAVGLALYPRYTGAIFNNSKDVPLAVAMLLVLWLVMRLARRWQERPGEVPWLALSLVGLALGAAMSIRVNALVWYGILGLFGAAWLLARRWSAAAAGRWRSDLRRVLLAAIVVGLVSYATIMALWPYVFLNPVGGLPDAFASMSRYQWNHPIMFDGVMVSAMDLPRTYPLTWLWLGSPWPTVLLALVGVAIVAGDSLRRRVEPAALLVVAAAVLPLLALVALRPTLYNGLRHFLFVVPPLVLIAAYALVRLLAWLADVSAWRRVAAGAVVVVAIATQVQVVVGVARLYPYEYMYFNAAAGGFRGNEARYETDYWGQCSRAAAEWLDDHWHRLTPGGTALVQNKWAPTATIQPYLRAGLEALPSPGTQPDFGIYSLMNWRPDPWPGYRTVHEVVVEGDTICRVEMNPALS